MKRLLSVLLAVLLLCSVAVGSSYSSKVMTLDELAEMINSEMSEQAFSVEARADESVNCFVYEIRANTIPYDIWAWCTEDVKDEYKSKFAEIVKKVDDSVDKIGYTDVTTIAMFTLSNGEVTYMAVNGVNVYESQGSINKSAPEPTVTNQPATEAKKYTELKLGDSGMQVYKMKKKLVQYGYLEN